MTNLSLFNGNVRYDVSGGPVRNIPQVTKSDLARNCFPQRNANRYDAEVTCPLVT